MQGANDVCEDTWFESAFSTKVWKTLALSSYILPGKKKQTEECWNHFIVSQSSCLAHAYLPYVFINDSFSYTLLCYTNLEKGITP